MTFQESFMNISEVFKEVPRSSMEVSRVFQANFKEVSREFQGCFKSASKVFQGCVTGVSSKFLQGSFNGECFKGDLRVFNGVSRVFQRS